MGKIDAMRAMREAKYAARQAQAGPSATAARPRVAPPTRPAATPPLESAATGDDLCGHRSLNGRTCTRERGHAAKSHRYG